MLRGHHARPAKEVVGLLRRELEDVAEGGLTEEEFERAKGHVKGSLVLSLEDPGGRMSRLGKSEIAHGEILTVDQSLKRVEAVTLEDARRVAERVLSQPMTLTVLGPFAPARSRGGRWRDPRRRARRHRPDGRRGLPGGAADPDLELVAGDLPFEGGRAASTALGLEGSDVVLPSASTRFVEAEVEVAVDFTTAAFAPEHVAWAIEHGVHIVVGTTGFDVDEAWRDSAGRRLRRPELRDRRAR